VTLIRFNTQSQTRLSRVLYCLLT